MQLSAEEKTLEVEGTRILVFLSIFDQASSEAFHLLEAMKFCKTLLLVSSQPMVFELIQNLICQNDYQLHLFFKEIDFFMEKILENLFQQHANCPSSLKVVRNLMILSQPDQIESLEKWVLDLYHSFDLEEADQDYIICVLQIVERVLNMASKKKNQEMVSGTREVLQTVEGLLEKKKFAWLRGKLEETEEKLRGVEALIN